MTNSEESGSTHSEEKEKHRTLSRRSSFGGSRNTSPRRPHKYEIKATGEAARSYNFRDARPPGKKTTVVESIGHLIKSCLGGGVVAIHEAYKECGLWTSVVLTVILGVFVSHCMYGVAAGNHWLHEATNLVLRSGNAFVTDLEQDTSYVLADLFGSCCVYQVMIARTIKQLVENVEDVTAAGGTSIRVFIATLLIPCILICMITSLKYLAPFSLVADFFILTVAAATIYYAVTMAQDAVTDMPVFKTLSGLMEFMGVCVFSMEGIGATLAIENSMEEPKKIGLVLAGGMSVVVSIVLCMGFFGYWGFGEKSKSPVTVNFPLTAFPIVLKVLMAFMVYVTFALNFWIPFELVWHYIKRRYDPAKYWFWERVYRAIFVFFITVIAVVFPNVSKFIGVLGSFCLSNMGFIYPAFIELCLDWEDPGLGVLKWRLWKSLAIILFGLLLCVIGTYSNVVELFKEVF